MCKFDGCDRASWCKGYCSKHYYYAQRKGLLPRPECLVVGCGAPAYRKGMCNAHNLRTERHGSPHVRKKAANGECKDRPCCIEGCGGCGFGIIDDLVYCATHHRRMRRYGDPNTCKKLGNGHSTPERRLEVARRAMKRYNQTPHGKMRRRFNSAKRRVLQGRATGAWTITKDQFLELWHTKGCWICGQPMGDDRTLDHVIPLSKGGDNTLDNLRMAHMRCNQRKSSKIQTEPGVPPSRRHPEDLTGECGCGSGELARSRCRVLSE